MQWEDNVNMYLLILCLLFLNLFINLVCQLSCNRLTLTHLLLKVENLKLSNLSFACMYIRSIVDYCLFSLTYMSRFYLDLFIIFTIVVLI